MRQLTSFFFLATLFCCTFEKVHWDFGGAVALSDILAICFIVCFVVISRPRVPRRARCCSGSSRVFVLVYLIGFYNLDTAAGLAQFEKGFAKFLIHFAFLALAVAWLCAPRAAPTTGGRSPGSAAGSRSTPLYGVAQLAGRAGRGEPRLGARLAAHRRREPDQHLRRRQRRLGLPAERAHGDPNHLGIMLIVPLLVLTPLYLRLEPGHRLRRRLAAADRVPARRRDRDALAQRPARPRGRRARPRPALPRLPPLAGAARPVARGARRARRRRRDAAPLLLGRAALAHPDGRQLGVGALPGLQLHPEDPAQPPALRARAEQLLDLLPADHRQDELGPALLLRLADRRDRASSGRSLFACFLVWVFARLAVARALGRALARAHDPLAARVTPLAWGWTAALAGTLASNAFYLTM